jgi:fatty-acyl-CoA synthase
VDRVGDTFRWKSENVSTLEVQSVLEGFPEILFSTVYGVEVPGYEGRAGMVALMLKPGTHFDPVKFYAFASSQLPRYAMPQFVRVNKEMDMTGTYKLRKVDLQKQSYNPQLFDDQLFVIDEKAGCYVGYSRSALEKAGYKELAPANKSFA